MFYTNGLRIVCISITVTTHNTIMGNIFWYVTFGNSNWLKSAVLSKKNIFDSCSVFNSFGVYKKNCYSHKTASLHRSIILVLVKKRLRGVNCSQGNQFLENPHFTKTFCCGYNCPSCLI